jgi:hypothetical protein
MKTDRVKQPKSPRRRPSAAPTSAESPVTTAEQIARRAYELYEQRGAAPGHDWDDWLSAERELGSAG